jgi:hypothetical protein
MENFNLFKNDWITSLFDRNNVIEFPFVHLNVPSVLDDELFEYIKKNFIDGSCLAIDEISDDPVISHKEKRDTYFLTNELLKNLKDQSSKIFWEQFLKIFKSNVCAIKTQFLLEIEKLGIDQDIGIDNISLAFRFVTETLPFSLTPHIDMPQKLAVGVIYISSSGDLSAGGTHLYQRKSDGELKKCKAYEFDENRLVLIPRVENSWHGGEWPGNGTRKTFHIYFFRHSSDAANSIRNEYRFLM